MRMNRRFKYKAIAVFMLAFMLAQGCSADNGGGSLERVSATGLYLDTVVTLTAYGAEKSVLDAALELCADYEAMFSKTIEGSDVWRINHAGGEPVEVAEETITILTCAERISELSGGAFDITIEPVMELWNFTGTTGAELPGADEIAAAAALTDYRKLVINGNVVTLPQSMRIDLGGIAKGFIADAIGEYLRGQNVKHALLNFGGNIVLIADKPDGSAWTIGVQDPDMPGNSIVNVAAIDNSLVTSGIYERGFTLDGVLYHHILDTQTGWPVQNELASVTIIADNSMLADALSTACLAMGLDRARTFLEQFDGVEAVFVTRDREVIQTDGVLLAE